MATGNLFVNGVQHFDGAPTLVNGVTPASIVCEGVTVWLNNYPPAAPTSFVAADGTSGVTCTWINPADDGVPNATYDVYENDVLVGANVTNGWVRAVTPGTRTYYVRAVNVAGYANSNTDSGTSVQPSGAQTFTTSDTWTVPADVYSVNVCLVGGGGGGAAGEQGGAVMQVGGGYSGGEDSGTIAVSPGAVHAVTVGAGGPKSSDPQGGGAIVNGYAGAPSSFISLSGAGGGGGNTSGGYSGNSGAGPGGCGGGGHSDGSAALSRDSAWGGQASSFGSGAPASHGGGVGNTGGVGAGGGARVAVDKDVQYGGPGGRGEVRLTW